MQRNSVLTCAACCLIMAAVVFARGAAGDEPKDKDAKAAAEKALQEELKSLAGTWKITSMIADGRELEEDSYKTWRRIVDGTNITWKNADGTFLETSIKIDPSKKPKQIDSTIESGDDKGKVMLAIYEVKGDEFRMCFAPPDMPRPTEFASRAGMNGVWLYTAKRVKEKDKE